MRIVITGGSGLIGRAVARDLGEAGYEVVLLTRNTSKVGALPPNTRAVQWDGRTPEGWGKLLDEDTGILHLAGDSVAEGRWTGEKKRRIRDSRVQTGQAVLEAVRQAKSRPKLLLQGSAVGYYGDGGDQVLTESSPPGDDFLARVCVEWEASAAEVSGDTVTSTRGPRDRRRSPTVSGSGDGAARTPATKRVATAKNCILNEV